MRRLLLTALAVTSLGLAAAHPAGADRAIEGPSFHDVFVDVDPCTGIEHEVTLDRTFSVHDHDGQEVAHGHRTLHTDAGYTGEGKSTYVINGEIERYSFHDMLTDDDGNRIIASGVFVFDMRRDTVRIDNFALRCAGSA